MAERKQGPVKPPTIDLTPRDATADVDRPPRRTGGRKAAAETVAPATSEPIAPETPQIPQTPQPPDPPRRISDVPAGRGGSSWTTLLTAAGVGALLGTALTYVLATVVPLPGPVVPDLGPALGSQADRVAVLEQRVGAVEEGSVATRAAAETASAGVAQQVAVIEAAIAEIRGAIPAPADTTGIETRLRALSSRVDAIAAGASSADAGAIAENIGDLEEGLAALQTEVDAFNSRVGAVDGAMTALETEVSALKSTVETAAAEPEPEPAAPLPQLPLIVSGLESAFATGKPFAAELTSLSAALPEVAIEAPLAAQAAGGLARPDVLDLRFAEAVPAMLAARPAGAGDWQKATGDWIVSLLALRPAEEVEGDTPDAVVSRLEGAMSRHDYAAATALFAQLPPEMVAAAGTVPGDIAAHAAAAALVAQLREQALAPAGAAP